MTKLAAVLLATLACAALAHENRATVPPPGSLASAAHSRAPQARSTPRRCFPLSRCHEDVAAPCRSPRLRGGRDSAQRHKAPCQHCPEGAGSLGISCASLFGPIDDLETDGAVLASYVCEVRLCPVAILCCQSLGCSLYRPRPPAWQLCMHAEYSAEHFHCLPGFFILAIKFTESPRTDRCRSAWGAPPEIDG